MPQIKKIIKENKNATKTNILGLNGYKYKITSGNEIIRIFFQKELGKKIRTKFTPKIIFYIDDTFAKILEYIKQRIEDGKKHTNALLQELSASMTTIGL